MEASKDLFDAILVGVGQAVPALANRLTSEGWKIAVIERHLVGGTCVNFGCTPTKAMIACAHTARLASRAAEFGVIVPGLPSVDLSRVRERTQALVRKDREGLETWIAAMPGCELIRGHARFESPHRLRVGDRVLESAKIFLDVGARAAIPDIPGLKEAGFLTSTNMLDLTVTPRHLLILGGGPIAVEFAQMFRRFGSDVTIIDRSPRLLRQEDEDISNAIGDILQHEGINLCLAATPMAIQQTPEGPSVSVQRAADVSEIAGSHLLVATGRSPNTDDLGLAAAGIEVDGKRYIVVDDHLRTTAEGVWALGDCNGRGAFTHTAYNDFEIVVANLLDNEPRSVSDRIRAYALYIDPPLGRVGMTLAEARQTGQRIRIGERPMTRIARAKAKGETQGLMRIVVDADTDRILGASILGPGADEAIHAVLSMMSAGASATRLAHTVNIHPTVSEFLPTLIWELSEPSKRSGA